MDTNDHIQAARVIAREERRRQSRRALIVVGALFVFAALMVVLRIAIELDSVP